MIIGAKYYFENSHYEDGHISNPTIWFVTRSNVPIKKLNKLPMFILFKIFNRTNIYDDKCIDCIKIEMCRQTINTNANLVIADIDYEYESVCRFLYNPTIKKFKFNVCDSVFNPIFDNDVGSEYVMIIVDLIMDLDYLTKN